MMKVNRPLLLLLLALASATASELCCDVPAVCCLKAGEYRCSRPSDGYQCEGSYGDNGWRKSTFRWGTCGMNNNGKFCGPEVPTTGPSNSTCGGLSCTTGCCLNGKCLPVATCARMLWAWLTWVLIGGVCCCGGCAVMVYLFLFKRKKSSNYRPVHAPPAVVYQPPLAVQQQGYPQQSQTVYYGKQQQPQPPPTVHYPQHLPQTGYNQQAAYQQPQMVYGQQAMSQQPQVTMTNPTAPPAPPPAPPPMAAVAMAEPAAPTMQTITVPPGYGPGKILKLKVAGKEHKIKIPEGKTTGTTFDINLALLPGGK
jgi:hypothetical protein